MEVEVAEELPGIMGVFNPVVYMVAVVTGPQEMVVKAQYELFGLETHVHSHQQIQVICSIN
jgi:uncharacterized membrane protein YuzA (DUF378 family)